MLSGCVRWPENFHQRYRNAGYWHDETLGELLGKWAIEYPERTAVVAGEDRWSFAEFDRRATSMAAGLSRIGLNAGDRVIVHLPNRAEFAVVCFALFHIGAVPVLALPAHRDTEILHLCRVSEAAAYVVPDQHDGLDFLELAHRVVAEAPYVQHVLVAGEAQQFTSLEDLYDEPNMLRGDASSSELQFTGS